MNQKLEDLIKEIKKHREYCWEQSNEGRDSYPAAVSKECDCLVLAIETDDLDTMHLYSHSHDGYNMGDILADFAKEALIYAISDIQFGEKS